MNTSVVSRLARALAALPKKNRDNLAFHLKAKTPICCGRKAMFFVTTDGAG